MYDKIYTKLEIFRVFIWYGLGEARFYITGLADWAKLRIFADPTRLKKSRDSGVHLIHLSPELSTDCEADGV